MCDGLCDPFYSQFTSSIKLQRSSSKFKTKRLYIEGNSEMRELMILLSCKSPTGVLSDQSPHAAEQ